MKTGILITFWLLLFVQGRAQVVFWSENFENNCSSGCAATAYSGANGAWSVTSTGVNGPDANIWFVSCAENGQATGICGAGCGTDESMHVGSSIYGDLGAAYLAGGMGTTPETNRRVNSPVINCTGRNTITLSFVYIENGEGTTDNATLKISYNGGTTWSDLADMGKTPLCVSGQGRWQTYSVVLPASANNNANVRLGFNWTNNNNTGTDPSFAVDDIQLSVVAPMPVELVEFNGKCSGTGQAVLSWMTASETGNDHFEIEQSADGVQFHTVAAQAGAGNSNTAIAYEQAVSLPEQGAWYRLKQVDYDGQFALSSPVRVECLNANGFDNTLVGYQQETKQVLMHFLPPDLLMQAMLSDTRGRPVFEKNFYSQSGINYLDAGDVLPGVYLLKLSSDQQSKSFKLIIN